VAAALKKRSISISPRPSQLNAQADLLLPHGTPLHEVGRLATAVGGGKAGRGEFFLHEKPLHLPSVGPKDPMVYRIQCLRAFLASALGGEKQVLELVRRVEKRRNADSVDMCKTVKALLPDKHKVLLPLIFQLLEVRACAQALSLPARPPPPTLSPLPYLSTHTLTLTQPCAGSKGGV
jgi:hypothetical protein